MGVLFELIARRYDYLSIAVAANQLFSGLDEVFPDKAMTVVAIDHLIHHTAILEMNAESFLLRAAISNKGALREPPATTLTDKQGKGERCVQTIRKINLAASKLAKVVVPQCEDF